MKKHDIVKFTQPEDEREARFRFVLMDDPALAIARAEKLKELTPGYVPRVEIKLVENNVFAPIQSVPLADLTLAMTVNISQVPHADHPKKKVWHWEVIDHEHPGNDYGGYSDTEDHALTDAAIVIITHVQREQERHAVTCPQCAKRLPTP